MTAAVRLAPMEVTTISLHRLLEVPHNFDAVVAIDVIYPNPMNPASNVIFTLASPGRARIDIFSVDGRLVRTLLDASQPAGTFQVRWDGTDLQGNRAASGTYVLRLRRASAVDLRKVVLVK